MKGKLYVSCTTVTGLAGRRYMAVIGLAGRRYMAVIGLAGRRYMAVTGLAGRRYMAVIGSAGSRYRAVTGLAGRRYMAVIRLAGRRHRAVTGLAGRRYRAVTVDKYYLGMKKMQTFCSVQHKCAVYRLVSDSRLRTCHCWFYMYMLLIPVHTTVCILCHLNDFCRMMTCVRLFCVSGQKCCAWQNFKHPAARL